MFRDIKFIHSKKITENWPFVDLLLKFGLAHFFWTVVYFSWVDFRINSTDISSLKSIAQYQMSNIILYKILGTIMIATKLSNIVFNFVVFITIIMYFRRQQKKQEHRKGER